MKTIIELKNISKYFMSSRALHQVDLSIFEGECLGIVGHNGAGKSTMVNILTGTYPPTEGELYIDGELQPPGYDIFSANSQGIRVVFQELSLCPNLTVAENIKVFHPNISGFGWKKLAQEMIISSLDEIFPDHGIHPDSVVSSLTLGQRQMVEIAKAFTAPDKPLRLVILDEPTSALDHKRSRQLIDYLDTLREKKLSVIYISHLLDEVLASTDRIVVMKDGIKVGVEETATSSRESIIELMGEAKADIAKESAAETAIASKKDQGAAEKRIVIEPRKQNGEVKLRVHEGEIVGLTGLAGHGQTALLIELFDGRKNPNYKVHAPVTFLPGDRQADGVFPIWSITRNITVQVYNKVRKLFLIDSAREENIARRWQDEIDIKAGSIEDNILSLSGGNQQKAIFSRCLESSAKIVLMDDPTRGVDVGTKEVIYRRILKEREAGRSFVWYTTEMDELQYCDRLYVFKGGKIIAELLASEASEEDILKASF
ncbi:sugar ABC transporter ATP-binding protein [Marispirochaeta aestuarii]|uniref:sugar ABC transporter ATP-binding protein n=1 Tax=Marispirochaeta aestuarii TaxID=1963862 RepID=UPI002ABD1C13|nr:sugar ABC transporter ATP-binding protein [Marispirochaeta aestuarii]